jgi:hypothetical protein
MSVEYWSNDTDRRKLNYPKKSLFSRHSTKNLPRIVMGSNPSLRGDRLPTNRLNHNTIWVIIWNSQKKNTARGKKADSVMLNFAYSYWLLSFKQSRKSYSHAVEVQWFLNRGHVFESVSQYYWMTALISCLTFFLHFVDCASCYDS